MEIGYVSRTGKIEQLLSKLGLQNTNKILSGGEKASSEFILFTYTDGFGEVPELVRQFLSQNKALLRGVAGSGNRNFGRNFCNACKSISQEYNVPLLATFELSGSQSEIEVFKERGKKLQLEIESI